MSSKEPRPSRLTNNELQHAIERAEADIQRDPKDQKNQVWLNDLRYERAHRVAANEPTGAGPAPGFPLTQEQYDRLMGKATQKQEVKTLNDLLREHPDWGDLPVFIYDGSDRENVLGQRVTAYVSSEPPVDWSCQGQWLIFNTD
jgi:hypothetical protein